MKINSGVFFNSNTLIGKRAALGYVAFYDVASGFNFIQF